jgi:hypothetical protein
MRTEGLSTHGGAIFSNWEDTLDFSCFHDFALLDWDSLFSFDVVRCDGIEHFHIFIA